MCNSINSLKQKKNARPLDPDIRGRRRVLVRAQRVHRVPGSALLHGGCRVQPLPHAVDRSGERGADPRGRHLQRARGRVARRQVAGAGLQHRLPAHQRRRRRAGLQDVLLLHVRAGRAAETRHLRRPDQPGLQARAAVVSPAGVAEARRAAAAVCPRHAQLAGG